MHAHVHMPTQTHTLSQKEVLLVVNIWKEQGNSLDKCQPKWSYQLKAISSCLPAFCARDLGDFHPSIDHEASVLGQGTQCPQIADIWTQNHRKKPAISTPPLLCPDSATPPLNSCLSNDSGLFRPLKWSHSGRQRAKANAIKPQCVACDSERLPPNAEDDRLETTTGNLHRHSRSVHFVHLKRGRTRESESKAAFVTRETESRCDVTALWSSGDRVVMRTSVWANFLN